MHKITNKSLIIYTLLFLLILMLALPLGVMAEEKEQIESENVESTTDAQIIEQDRDFSFISTFKDINVENVNENQMSLLMINSQIEYLMLQIQEKEQTIEKLNIIHQDTMEKLREDHQKVLSENRETISELRQEIKDKDQEIKAAREETHELEKKIATYIGESGLYLKMLISGIAGVIIGLILGSILNFRKNKKTNRSDSSVDA